MQRTLAAGAIALAFVVTGTARGADLRPITKAPPAPVAAIYDWSGVYVGGQLGYAWTQKDWFAPNGVQVGTHEPKGFIGGGQIGFNWQTGGWVMGIEAEASWSHLREGRTLTSQTNIQDGTSNTVFGDGSVRRGGTTVDALGSIAGRVGYAWDRWLGYAKGGAAWANDLYRIFNIGVTPEVLNARATDTRWGWMVGTGIEYGLAPNWSAKVEFDYMDFGTERTTFTGVSPGVPAFALDVKQTVALVKAGINYRFGAGWLGR